MCPLVKRYHGGTLLPGYVYRPSGGFVDRPRIGIIIGTTRQGRFADRPARWIEELARTHGALDVELVDLRDYPLPFFDELRSPAWVAPTNEVAIRWGKKVEEFDGYIFVTAEYNHS